MNPIPRTVQEWIIEIRAAHADAAETIPFGPLAGTTIAASDLFRLAPIIMLKFRSLPRTKKNLNVATEAAFSTYVASTSKTPALLNYPSVCFALAYLASHYAFDLLSKKKADQILAYILANPRKLVLSEAEFNRSLKKVHPNSKKSIGSPHKK